MLMKKQHLLIFCILLTGYIQSAKCQLPQKSTEGNPVWYYIQVKGESERTNLVFTVENDFVFGKVKVSSSDFSLIDKQLWRFEQNGNNYVIINKSNGKKFDITYNEGKGINAGIVNSNPSTNWQLQAVGSTGYYNIKAVTSPATKPAEIYAHQANNYDDRNYAIMFESAYYSQSDNSLFHFIEYENPIPSLSNENVEIWYTIQSSKPGYENRCITDVTSEELPYVCFGIEYIEDNNLTQQWKLVKKSDAENDERVQLINRATGNMIQTKTVYNTHYYTQCTQSEEESNGWILDFLGDDQFEIFGTDENGNIRYLNAASGMEEPDTYLEGNNLNSGFTWIFKKKATTPSLPSRIRPNTLDDVLIYSKDRRIVVTGASDYKITNMVGITLRKDTELLPGMYLVTVNGITSTILVK